MTRAAEALPDHAEAQYLRGVFFQDEGQYQQAEESYTTAIALDPTFSRAHNALGSVYERTGRLNEAIASNRGRFAQSRKMFETVLEFLPDDDFAAQWLMRLDREARQ